MSWTAMFEPMFFTPFATGLLVAAVLPMLGMYLRLREEWLAALAFAQLAAEEASHQCASLTRWK